MTGLITPPLDFQCDHQFFFTARFIFFVGLSSFQEEIARHFENRRNEGICRIMTAIKLGKCLGVKISSVNVYI